MVKRILASIIFIFSGLLFAQGHLPWSSPQLLCDTIGDNYHPSFVRVYADGVSYNVLLWARDYGSHSEIYLKYVADPDSEIAVNSFAAGGFSQKPAGAYLEYNGAILIVWQSDQGGNFDLYSIVYQNGQFLDYRQITTDPGDDVNPALSESGLVWERDGSVYYSRYSLANLTWSAAELVDSAGSANPTIAGAYWDHSVAYQKPQGGEFKIYRRGRNTSGSWSAPQLLSPDGDNRLPRYSNGLPLSLIWQHKEGGDWNIMNLHEWIGFPTPTLFVFSPNDEVRPAALEVPIISKGYFYPPLYFAFESANPAEAPEIYINDLLYDTVTVRNISGYPGIDQNPALSEFSYLEAGQYMAKAWLAWESFRNGQWQIWGSFAETNLPGLGIEDPPGALADYRLFQNYPNPFNPETAISYQLSAFSDVELAIYNLLGQKVRTMVRGRQPAGRYEVKWDGRDEAGREVSSGVYIYRLRAGDPSAGSGHGFVQSRKMLLFR